ncbi:uncharacterized protein LOC113762181 [Coffea eugenioides]|uniref:uncharacterized protein LOC113762181 n=1 Tax=Coffea eugenioides TaxID=49369 RepID=UPI000F60D738|nr:uncharacterized protein LOC113762181 [Coffea eugenioides]XP_027161298.1 uncharacterized protein LOC113762181 [Coffea eugenioides]XP_027161299.1 uncharacterized protein LOC113762181 [Coffea eugenioides]XP_027161300.1 uncharacterized protein LOC113762181 [Coffea eugenioides]XP_027161301.1 uncharacterized protein LOC113762181 [Coffea eugenioides]
MKVNQLCCFVLLLMMMALCDASRLINYFNKAPLKSIKSKDGDVIDCILLSEQPALDHPLLKDHRILMTPSYHPEGLKKLFNSRNDEKSITQLWQLAGRCPQGSIPIRRGKKEDGFFSVIKSFLQKDETNREKLSAGMELISQVKSYQSVASYAMGAYYGAKAIMNVWQPQLQQPNEYSSSQLWITENSFGSNQNTIQAGWHVNPELYGDARTRFFMHWTRDNFKSTGCYNLLCSGFVQITNEIVLGGSVFPLSNFNGSQSEISILIWKDPAQDAWWLEFGNTIVGYWPGSLLTSLAHYSSLIEWGALVLNKQSDGVQTSTQMGSGHFPREGFKRASYMRNLEVIGSSMKLRPLNYLRTIARKSNCYDITVGENADWGNYIFYGGPGRNPSCP